MLFQRLLSFVELQVKDNQNLFQTKTVFHPFAQRTGQSASCGHTVYELSFRVCAVIFLVFMDGAIVSLKILTCAYIC